MKISSQIISILGVIVLYTLIPACQKTTQETTQNTSVAEISKLLANTTDSASISLMPSFEAAKKALGMSQSSGNDTLIIQSWLAMGSNLRLRGKNVVFLKIFKMQWKCFEK